MKDKGLVIRIQDNLAQVQVSCLLESCQGCAARALCLREDQAKSLITVQNSMRASPGDEVEIDIPDEKYARSLILIFSSLLASSILGLATGYLLSPFFPLSPWDASLAGLFLFLFLAGLWLIRYFKRKNRLYPVITGIIKKRPLDG